MSVSINGTNGLTFNDATTQTTSAFTGGLAFRNRIINGAMVIDQRNAGASVTANDSVFPVDRFSFVMSQASKGTGQRSTVASANFVNSLLFTSSSAYAVGSGETFNITQKIEGFNVADLGWGTASAQTVTLSFWVRSSLTGTFGGSFRNGAANRSYPFSYTISAANTWEQKAVVVAGDTSGTWATDNSIGVQIYFGLGVGSTLSGTAGAWAATSYTSATGAVSVVGTAGATFYITGVQLEKGSTATSFDYRDYGRELIMCQRYFYKAGPINLSTQAFSTTEILVNVTPPPMRSTPTLSLSTVCAVNSPVATFTQSSASLDYFYNTVHLTTFTPNLTTGLSYAWTSGTINFSAEL